MRLGTKCDSHAAHHHSALFDGASGTSSREEAFVRIPLSVCERAL